MTVKTALKKAKKELSCISKSLIIGRIQIEFTLDKDSKFDTHLTVFYTYYNYTQSNMTITVYNEIDFDCALTKAIAEFKSKVNPKNDIKI